MTRYRTTCKKLSKLGNSVRIPGALRRDVENVYTRVFVSIASTKPGSYVQKQLERQRFGLLDRETAHLNALALLPHSHRYPFDRMIVAQAEVESLTIVTADRILGAYAVATVLI